MKTLIRTPAKLNISTFNNQTYHEKKQLIHSKSRSDFKFYQKLSLMLLTLSTFLIFPESPKDSDILCNKYQSKEVCNVW